MGDKIEAKTTATRLGIPCVPGSPGAVTGDKEAVAIARALGFPVLVKAAAGGGGRGMKVARTANDLPVALETARIEAKAAFGDDRSISKSFSKSRAISKSRFLATATARLFISANAIARCSAGIRKSGRKAPPPPSTHRSA